MNNSYTPQLWRARQLHGSLPVLLPRYAKKDDENPFRASYWAGSEGRSKAQLPADLIVEAKQLGEPGRQAATSSF